MGSELSEAERGKELQCRNGLQGMTLSGLEMREQASAEEKEKGKEIKQKCYTQPDLFHVGDR